MSGAAYDGRRHRDHGRGDPRRRRRDAVGRRRPAGRRALAQWRHDLRNQERLRPDRRRRGSAALDIAGRSHSRNHVPRCPRRARRVPRRSRRLRRAWSRGPMLTACAPLARWIDVFCDRGAFDVDEARTILHGRRRRRPRSAPACRPARAGRGHPARRRAGRGVGGPLHVCRPTLTSRRSPAQQTPSPRCCPAPNSPPAHRGPTASGSSTRASRSRWRRTAIPGTSFTTSMPFCIAVAVRDMHFTPAAGVVGGHRGRGGRAAPRRRRSARASAGAPTSSGSMHRPTFTWPTGPACPSSTTSCNPALPTQRKQIEQ